MDRNSEGIIKYCFEYKLIIEVDQDLSYYYKSLIPKYIVVNPQRHPAHISVVRKEIPNNINAWGKYEGEKVEFKYSNIIENDETYYWLNVQCDRLKEIRTELGLSAYPWWRNKFHITIANCKII